MLFLTTALTLFSLGDLAPISGTEQLYLFTFGKFHELIYVKTPQVNAAPVLV